MNERIVAVKRERPNIAEMPWASVLSMMRGRYWEIKMVPTSAIVKRATVSIPEEMILYSLGNPLRKRYIVVSRAPKKKRPAEAPPAAMGVSTFGRYSEAKMVPRMVNK